MSRLTMEPERWVKTSLTFFCEMKSTWIVLYSPTPPVPHSQVLSFTASRFPRVDKACATATKYPSCGHNGVGNHANGALHLGEIATTHYLSALAQGTHQEPEQHRRMCRSMTFVPVRPGTYTQHAPVSMEGSLARHYTQARVCCAYLALTHGSASPTELHQYMHWVLTTNSASDERGWHDGGSQRVASSA